MFVAEIVEKYVGITDFRSDFGSLMDGDKATGFVPNEGSQFSGTLTNPEAVEAVIVYFSNGTNVDVTITDEDNDANFLVDDTWTDTMSKTFTLRKPFTSRDYKVTFGAERPFVTEIEFHFIEQGELLILMLISFLSHSELLCRLLASGEGLLRAASIWTGSSV